MIADDTATFTDFAARSESVFTRGDADTIRFAERPMWLSVDTSGQDSVTFEAHDAANDGQPIRVDASWLEAHGVEGEPIAYYHDGTTIPVEATADGTAYVVDAPHFSHITLASPGLDSSWQIEGHTRSFSASGPTGAGAFNITVSDVTSDTIEYRFWSVQNGSRNVFDGDEPFERVDRESLARSGYYSFNFINETNLQTGYAMLGDERFHLVEVNLDLVTYDFSDGNLTYKFDQTTGLLKQVVDSRNNAWITQQDVRTDSVPGGSGSAAQSADLTAQYIEVDSVWNNDCSSDGAGCSADVDPPTWSDGDPDEMVQGSILADETEVSVVADYDLRAYIADLTACNNTDCQAIANSQLHVHWNGSDDRPTDSVKCPDGNGPCYEGNTAKDECNDCTFSATGTITHTDCQAGNLLCGGYVDFWLCADGSITEENVKEDTDVFDDCRLGNKHPHDPAETPEGRITVDPWYGIR